MKKPLLSALMTLIIILLPTMAGAASGIGQSYKAFEASYAENIVFINENTGRMLLPHSLTRDYDAAGKRMYRINRGALAVEMHMDESGERIASLLITLAAPQNMSYGDPTYTDFATAGYHSYALMMAMSLAEDAKDRYAVVEEANWGVKQMGGTYEMQVGDYTLSCKSENGVAQLHFVSSILSPQKTEEEETHAPEMNILDFIETEEDDSLAG